MVQVDAEAYFRTPWHLDKLKQPISESACGSITQNHNPVNWRRQAFVRTCQSKTISLRHHSQKVQIEN
jgi:hypothetical protein